MATERSIIAITGVKGSGKSTAAAFLSSRFNLVEKSFAGPLKAMAEIAFPLVPKENFYGPSSLRELEVEAYPMNGSDPETGRRMAQQADGSWVSDYAKPYPKCLTARTILTTLGTEWGRRLYDNVWVDSAISGVENIVLADMRFLNEATAVAVRGGITIRLNRGLEAAREEAKKVAPHSSEYFALFSEDSEFDYVVQDGMTKEETTVYLETILNRYAAG